MKRAQLTIKATTLAVISALATISHAAETTLDSVVIIGSTEAARTLPGSGAVVGNEQLKTEMITDINQALKTVPGVYAKEEDGHGLRTHVGIRAATGERSAKVTLMEDRVLIAPAPYSDPAAYYTPTALRMHSIEVLKGAPLLRHGPQTTGGVVNFVSTPIPAANGGKAVLAFGSHQSQDMHVNYGGRAGQVSWLLETAQRSSDGFKEIDRSNRDSGFRISDYVAKLGWESASGPKQTALLKIQKSEETSNETYLGLTDADFARDPNRRYGLSSIDQMNNDHKGTSLTYSLALADNTTMTATLYRNEFARDWFKLDGGSTLINNANAGNATSQGILNGTTDTTNLRYKHNSREYYSQGIDLNFDFKLGAHLLKIGGRVHEDESDRFQPVDVFNQTNGSLVFASTIQPAAGDNRIGSSEATALWIQDDWQITDRLNANLSLRHEDVESKEVRFTDTARTVVNRTSGNASSELLPGASFTFDLTPAWQVLAGVHKGFSPLGAEAPANQEAETSTNWEFGGRYRNGVNFVEVIGFQSDFSDKTELCSVGTPCSNGATSGSNVLGEAEVTGIELQAGTRFQVGAFALPLNASYTWTEAEVTADKSATVKAGDQLKDIPEHIFSLRAGLEHTGGWNNYLVAKFTDETCVANGCNRTAGAFGKTQSLFVMDYISRYRVQKDAEVFLKVENLFDEQKIVARTPDGARPNKPLSVAVGVSLGF